MSDELKALVEDAAREVNATGVASYIFYDREGQGIQPHVDTDIFSMNVLLMLEHEPGVDGRSDLVLLPPGQPLNVIPLKPGKIVIFYAGGIMHGRQPLHVGERVTILTFGFQPKMAQS